MIRYLFNILAAVSQFGNALLGGDRDQSFSARAYEASLVGKWWGHAAVAAVNTLFFFQPGHCARAYRSDNERTYMKD